MLIQINLIVALLNIIPQLIPADSRAIWLVPAFAGFAIGCLGCSLALCSLVIDYDKMAEKAKETEKLRKIVDFTEPRQDLFGYLVDEKGKDMCPTCWKHNRKVRVTEIGYCPVCGYVKPNSMVWLAHQTHVTIDPTDTLD